jgi:hypothetical protein
MRTGARLTAACVALLLASTPGPLAFRAQSPAESFLDAYLHGTRLVITTNDIPSLISDLDRRADAWIQADPTRAAERRRVVVIAPLDVARQDVRYLKSKLMEWACAFQRRSQPDEFDRLWMLTAAFILKDTDHSAHAQPRHPQESRISLAGLLSKPEAITVANLPNVDVSRLSSAEAQGYIGGIPQPIRVNDTIKALGALAFDPAVGSEATLRLGLVEYLTGRSANGIARFTSAAATATDPYLINLARMMEGLAHEAAGDLASAMTSYRAALEARPTISAALAVSSAMFLEGDRSGAATVLNRGHLDPSRAINPWHDPVGDGRFVSALINQLRESAGLPPLPTAVSSSAPASSVTGSTPGETNPPARAVSPPPTPAGLPLQFRSSTTSVMVDVAVFDGKTPVTGLTPDDFEILDNGVPQTIAARGAGDVPLDVTAVLDINDPVGRSNPDFPKLQGLKDSLRIGLSLTAHDRIRILVAASSGPVEIVSMQPAGGVQWQGVTVAGVETYPTSSIFDSLALALLSPVPADRRALVLLFTDGIDGASILTPAKVLGIARVADAAVYSARRYTFGELANQRNPGRTPTEISEMRHMLRPISPTVIDDIVRAADGRTLHPTEGAPMADTFTQVLRDFRQRYVFFYTPNGVSETGWHKLTVRLKKPRGYSITARRGYGL